MSLPGSEPLHPDGEDLPPARRRRRRRMIIPDGETQRAAFVNELSQSAVPSFDFFLFSIFSAIIMGAAFLLDEPGLYLLYVVVAPFLAPAVGLSLATVVGSTRYFLRALSGILVGGLLVLLVGAATGWASRTLVSGPYESIKEHANLSLIGITLTILGSALTTYLLARNPKDSTVVPNAILVYTLYLPLGAAGFGLASGAPELWPEGLMVFLVHLALSTLSGSIILAFLGLRPRTIYGYLLAGTLILISLLAAVLIKGFYTPVLEMAQYPTSTPTATITITVTRTPTQTVTDTPVPPTVTPTSTPTRTATLTPTETEVVIPTTTPYWAVVDAREGNGAVFRTNPTFNSAAVAESPTLLNGTTVQVFEIVQNSDGTWAHVKLPNRDLDGWILQDLLSRPSVTVTP